MDFGPSLEGGPGVGAPGADWDCEATGAVVGDFPSEPLELEGDGGVWYWDDVEWVSLGPVAEQEPG